MDRKYKKYTYLEIKTDGINYALAFADENGGCRFSGPKFNNINGKNYHIKVETKKVLEALYANTFGDEIEIDEYKPEYIHN